MAAGLPGFGLSGAFFIISALVMLPIEIVQTLRGRSSLARWGSVLRSAGLALAILAGLELTYAALHFIVGLVSASGRGQGGAAAIIQTIPIVPFLGTLGLVTLLMVSAKVAAMLADLRRRPTASGAPSATVRTEEALPERQRPARRPHGELAEASPS